MTRAPTPFGFLAPLLASALLFQATVCAGEAESISASPAELPRPLPGARFLAPQPTLDDAVQRVQRQTKGRVLSADETVDEGTPMFRIKMLMPSGRVRFFFVLKDLD